MSAYVTVATEYKDAGCLIAALEEMGYKVECHDEAQALYGYQGDARKEKANIIIRRQHVGSASNDVGFVKDENGSYRAIISEYDGRGPFNKGVQNKLAQTYGVAKVKKTAKAKGYNVVSEKSENGQVKMVLRRWS